MPFGSPMDHQANAFQIGGGTTIPRSDVGFGPSYVGGGNGGSMFPNAGQQASALADPGAVTASTPTDPNQQYAVDRNRSYEAGLADLTNTEITRELGRARDQISVGMEREGEGAVSRGADPSLFRSRSLAAGKRDLHALQGDLAGVALDKRQAALNGLTGAAGSAASERRMLHLGTIAARSDADRVNIERAEAQDRMYARPFESAMRMFELAGRYGGAGAGFGGGGEAGGGGGFGIGGGGRLRGVA